MDHRNILWGRNQAYKISQDGEDPFQNSWRTSSRSKNWSWRTQMHWRVTSKEVGRKQPRKGRIRSQSSLAAWGSEERKNYPKLCQRLKGIGRTHQQSKSYNDRIGIGYKEEEAEPSTTK